MAYNNIRQVIMMDFNTVIKKKLGQKKLKITDLARLSGVSYPYLVDLVKGRRRWNEDTIDKVCKALGIKVEFRDLESTGTDGPAK